jgi:hypothetical protein
LGASFSLAFRHYDYIAPSVKTEICIPIEEKYSQLILNTYLRKIERREDIVILIANNPE